jgi:hypothetical protein
MRRCRRGGVGFLAGLVALAAAAGCDLRLTAAGAYACAPDTPESCPAGWYCQMRAAYPGEYRCYDAPGPYCGDGTRDPGEVCDAKETFAADSCLDAGFLRGALRCRDDCGAVVTDGCAGGCGDGALDPGEECDGTPPPGVTCESLSYNPGTLACRADCTLDLSGCGGWCGDGVKNGAEQCDGPDLGAETCVSVGYHPGVLACGPDCKLAVAGCGGRCGDGYVNGDEACDGFDFAGQTCRDFPSPGTGPYYTGTLGCAADCAAVVTTGCREYCGDGVRNGPELCDGAALGGLTCPAAGFYGGTPACLATCDGYDLSGCTGSCGDGVKNGPEQCDGLDQGGAACTSQGTYVAGALGCDAYCRRTFDGCAIGWSPMPAGTTADLNTVWGFSGDDVYAVGTGGTVLHYDGVAWRTLDSGTDAELFGIWGAAPDDVFFAGTGGTILRYDGTTFTPLDAGTTRDLWWLWGSSASDVFAVGYRGIILHFNGTLWEEMTSGTVQYLYCVWGSAPDDVFAVGGTGTVLHYDGSAWSPMDAGTNQYLYDVWGRSGSDVYAFGWANTALHYDGSVWTPVPASAPDQILTGWGTDDTVYAVAPAGVILRSTGSSFDLMPSGTTARLVGIWCATPAGCFVVGTGGTILRLPGAERQPYAGACAPARSAYCGGTAPLAGRTTGEPAAHDSYGCGGRATTGAEMVYRLDSPITGTVTARLTPQGADLDLIVVGAAADGGCDPAQCVGASQHPDAAVEEVTFAATQATTYYLIVDGYDGAAGDYALEVSCARH